MLEVKVNIEIGPCWKLNCFAPCQHGHVWRQGVEQVFGTCCHLQEVTWGGLDTVSTHCILAYDKFADCPLVSINGLVIILDN